MQGAHQVAQKSTRTSLPRNVERDTGRPSRSGRLNAGARVPAGRGAAAVGAASKQSTAVNTALAVDNRISFFSPVGAEIVRDVQNLQLGEAELGQGFPGSGDIGATRPGTAAAIDHHGFGLVQGCRGGLQLGDAVFLAGWAGIEGA